MTTITTTTTTVTMSKIAMAKMYSQNTVQHMFMLYHEGSSWWVKIGLDQMRSMIMKRRNPKCIRDSYSQTWDLFCGRYLLIFWDGHVCQYVFIDAYVYIYMSPIRLCLYWSARHVIRNARFISNKYVSTQRSMDRLELDSTGLIRSSLCDQQNEHSYLGICVAWYCCIYLVTHIGCLIVTYV